MQELRRELDLKRQGFRRAKRREKITSEECAKNMVPCACNCVFVCICVDVHAMHAGGSSVNRLESI